MLIHTKQIHLVSFTVLNSLASLGLNHFPLVTGTDSYVFSLNLHIN
jgi:hypothetical protein